MSSPDSNVIQFPTERRQPERLLTAHELCHVLGFSERWLRYRVAEGMPARRWGKRLRFSLAEVSRWLDEREELRDGA